MSAIRRPKIDRFIYGWRDVVRKGRDGRPRLVQVPLTEEDVLHPCEGDHIKNNEEHAVDCSYLHWVYKSLLTAVAGALVLMDVPVYWDERALGHHSPDLTVIFGTRRRPRWTRFDVAREGVRPTMLLEITSQSTRTVDLNRKRREYYRAHVPLYVIVDELPNREEDEPRDLRIIGYRRGTRRYERLELNEQGRLWLDPIGIGLGVENGRVRCYDHEGNRIGDFTELKQQRDAEARARQQAEQRAVREAHARGAAEDRIRHLEAQLRRRNGR
jgi:hypothetical protein